ncbi:patatin-like phospholipase domain-containing protein 5 isoform 2-T2 [Sarcophilus harrisii]
MCLLQVRASWGSTTWACWPASRSAPRSCCVEPAASTAPLQARCAASPSSPTSPWAVLCSIYFPFYCGVIPPQFRGERYVDGALSNNVPFTDSNATITISPFYGSVDICPQSTSGSLHELNLCNASFQICVRNFHMGLMSLFPPEPEEVADFCRQGYLDALRFLESRGITKEGVITSLCNGMASSSSSVIWPASSNQGRNGGSEKEGKSGELFFNWKVPNVLVRDIAQFELLSPDLEAALKKSCERPNGFFARFSRSIPGQVLTYTLLPFTLPLEYVYFKTKRIINWIPEAPEDIRWMHCELKKFGGFVFSEVKDRLQGSAWLQNFSSPGSSNAMQSLPPQSDLCKYDHSKMHISLAEIVLPPQPLRA